MSPSSAPPEPARPPTTTEVSARPGPIQRLVIVWRYRELLGNLVRKELKVKYKNSVLGFLWSLLNPVLYLVVFTLVFKEILRVQVPLFSIFLLSGLLAWNLYSNSVSAGTTSIVGNASLVQKVWFPREILPLASIGASLVHFFLQMLVLFAALAIFRHAPAWSYAPALVPALLVLLLFSAAIAIGLAAVNVYLRDTQHLLELVLVVWFWLSAIVYPYEQVAERLGDKSWILLFNPIIPVVLTFQRVIYNPSDPGVIPLDVGIGWYLRNLAIVGAGSLVLLVLALWLFGRLEDDFAEEI
ncbi:MAG: ABC transporter permease [Acidimicrobiales bacterium]|nr:ABC transporter permease [Acidimicrobiales bacterium]